MLSKRLCLTRLREIDSQGPSGKRYAFPFKHKCPQSRRYCHGHSLPPPNVSASVSINAPGEILT
jgi:hypothetical protein